MPTGSSPRMRGTQVFCDDLSTRLGIIPAYAGNTLKCATMYTWVRDHPRVCGEHAHRNDNGTNDMGSSPRMRGTHPDIFVCADTKGIIPAYAGNTEPPTASQPLNRDHPRVCGEHPSINGVHPLSGGSSPRMRGTLTSGCDVSIRIGIIPAYAGNTARCSRMSLGSRDHPRVCGEHICGNVNRGCLWGSSPRMRGTRTRLLEYVRTLGIIPAYAGNTRFGASK